VPADAPGGFLWALAVETSGIHVGCPQNGNFFSLSAGEGNLRLPKRDLWGHSGLGPSSYVSS
jgi:hypothetical protein